MAYASLEKYLKQFPLLEKKSDAALQTYQTADTRSWTADKFEKSILIHDIITRPSTSHQTGDIDLAGISKNECIKKMAELRGELDKMHGLYKEASQKIEALEGATMESQKSQIVLRESQAKIMEQEEEYEKLLKERDLLREQLKNAEDLDEVRKKFKARADEADRMEEEICNLKRELEKCNKPAGCGDKMNIGSSQSCNYCESYLEELENLKKRVCMEERRSNETIAERNFLRQKTRTIDLLEAELILFKNKYHECECKIRALKEVICKNESVDRISQQSQCQLLTVESKLMEANCENDNLIRIIERLTMNLKERDLYINSLTKRLTEDCGMDPPKRAISFESIASGTVVSMVQKISKASANTSSCKCNVSNCKCGQISKCPSTISSKSSNCPKLSIIKKGLKKSISKCANGIEITKSQIDCMQIDKLICETRLLREQNCVLERELKRVKNDLSQMSTVVDEVEKHRKSNENLEGELNEIKCNYTTEISQISSKYQMSFNEKIELLNHLESRMICEMDKAKKLEGKVCEACKELSNLKEFRERCEALQKTLNCAQNKSYEQSRNAELLKKDCKAYFEENQKLKCQIDVLKCEIEDLCVKQCRSSATQREAVKKSIVEFKKQYDEKIQMIKCYEEKIKHLESENETLKIAMVGKSDNVECNHLFKKAAKFSLASLENDELVEIHDHIVRAMVDLNPHKPKVEIHSNYSKLFDEMCKKFSKIEELPVRDEFDETSSTRTMPNSRGRTPKKSCLKPRRSKSNDVCKKRKQSR